MNELVIPPQAQEDDKSLEMIRAWIASNGLHCSLNVGVWENGDVDEEVAWGILLADVIRHFSNAMSERYGADGEKVKINVVRALFSELEIPTSDVKGEFWEH